MISMEKPKHRLSRSIAKVKAYYQYILAAVLIAVTVCIVYGGDLLILANEALQSESFNHVLLIPFFAAFLIYLKRDMVKASLILDRYSKKTTTKYVDALIGASFCLAAFLIYWYGSNTFYPLEYHILSLPIFLFGLTLILFNLKATLILLLPILFLFFLVPLPTQFMYAAGGTMASFNTQASYSILKTAGLPVELSPAYGPPTIVLNTTNTSISNASQVLQNQFTIDLPCSGIYSLTAFAMFAVFLGLITTASITRKILIVVIGFLTFEILNVVRISTTIAIAYWFGQDIAMVLFHSVAGLILIFIGMLLTLFVGEKFLKIQILPSKKQTECPECRTNAEHLQDFCANCGRTLSRFKTNISREFWAKLFIVLLASSLIALSINAQTFAFAQGPTGLTSNLNWENATTIFPQIPNYELRFSYRDTAYEQLAGQDASLWYTYTNSSTRTQILVDVGVSGSMSNLHNWESCLISWQVAQGKNPLVPVLDQRDLQLLEDVPLIAQYLVFTRPPPYNYTQVTLYWYEKVALNTGITVEEKYVRISLLINTRNSTSYKQYEDELLPVAQAIAFYWEPLKAYSLISLGVPAQQAMLVASVVFVAFIETTQYSSDWRKRNNNMRIFKIHATAEEKTLLQTIENLHQKERKVTTNTIKEELNHDTGSNWELEKLLKALNRLEEYGFLKKDVRDTNNEPQLVWKI